MTITIGVIQRGKLEKLMPDLLKLEKNWVSIGERPWSSENFKVDLPGKWKLSLYASYQKRIVGYAICSIEGNIGRLNKILVDESLRNKGIGSKLWNELLRRCRELGLQKMEFKSSPDNPSAISFYRKKGCLFYGEIMGFDGKVRNTNMYVFRTKSRISHSKPSLNALDEDAVVNALQNKQLGSGEIAERFVAALCRYQQRRDGIAVNSGTSGLFLALRALGITAGDEVIIPSYVCYSVLSAVLQAGAKPVIADINSDDYCLSYSSAMSKATKNTKSIIVPHMFGRAAKDIDKFVSSSCPVIEDCAQSLGAKQDGKKAGTLGLISVYSFYATKVISTGIGGAVLSDDESINLSLKDMIRSDKRENLAETYNLRMSDLSASLGLSQLKRADDMIERRIEIAKKYLALFKESDVDFNLPSLDGIFYRFIIRHALKDFFMKSVNARGLACCEPVYKPLHVYLGLPEQEFPNTMRAFREAVSIPIYPSLTEEQVEECAGIILNWRQEVKK
ncbi:MAG TPA: GNAT family N-acetyltransferase [Candidatus Nanoarchaeia archaeon]|nr:GNAT family N-acetyltransferase [Candidatus Nanoarchaeia archaeon]